MKRTPEHTEISPAKRKNPSLDWKRELDHLKRSLIDARPVNSDRYEHAVSLIDGDLPEPIGDTHPRLQASGRRVHRVIPVKLPQGGYLVHFVFDHQPDEAEQLSPLIRIIGGIRRILESVPKRLLPTFTFPPGLDGRDENLLTWCSLLHFLGHVQGNTAFRTNLEFLNDKVQFDTPGSFADWERCSRLPAFDPVPFLTCTQTGEKTLSEWKAEHEVSGRKIPEVIAASLSKPLWHASINAIDQIRLLELNDGVVPAKRAHTKPRTNPSPDVSFLIHVLCSHHLPETGGACLEHLPPKRIGEKLKWNQTRVSRTLKALMGMLSTDGLEGVQAYKYLCDVRCIKQELTGLSNKHLNPHVEKHYTSGNLEWFADPKSHKRRNNSEDADPEEP